MSEPPNSEQDIPPNERETDKKDKKAGPALLNRISSLIPSIPSMPRLPVFSVPSSVFSPSAFLQGLGAGAAILLLLALWIGIRSADTQTQLQERIASRTVMIEETVAVETDSQHKAAHIMAINRPRSAEALPSAPLPDLYEQMENGLLLPKARTDGDGLTPFEAYRRPYQPQPGKVKLALVITGAGLSVTTTRDAADGFSPDVSFLLSPYADKPAVWSEALRDTGHEVWLFLPMQQQDWPDRDTGPLTVLVSAGIEQNQDRLFSILGSAAGYAGVVAGPDHAFTAADAKNSSVLRQIFGRGLAFVEPGNSVGFAAAAAREHNYPYSRSGTWLEEDTTPEDVKTALAAVERKALGEGQAALFLPSSPAALTQAQEWVNTLEAKGIQLVPLSALIER